MASFADLWQSEVVGPVNAGTFDPQGSNFSYALTSVPGQSSPIGGTQYITPTAPIQSTSAPSFSNPFDVSGSSNLSAGLPNSSAANVAPASNCAWYDVSCQAQSAVSSATSGVTNALSGVTSSIGDYFVRGAIVILGFIFVAVGLAMFNQKSIVNIAATAAKVVK